MSTSGPAIVAGVIGNAASLLLMVPQVVRLIRTRHTEGVSPTWAAIGVIINTGWLAYVINGGHQIALPAVVSLQVSFAVTLWLLRRNGAPIARGVMAGVALGVVLVAVQFTAGWIAVGTALALANSVHHAPSVLAVWRTHTPVGVSPGTWWLANLEGVAWSAYGLLVKDLPIGLFGLTACTAATAILVRLWIVRDRVKAVLEDPKSHRANTSTT